MDPRQRIERALPAFERLSTADLDHLAVRREANTILRRSLGFDVAVWATVDPVTVMWTHCWLDGMERDHALEAEVFDNEYRQRDVLKLADLAAAPEASAALSLATGGRLESSLRYRNILHPRGFADEMRVVLRDGPFCFGVLELLRAGRRRFAPEEVEAAAAIEKPLGRALRLALLRAAAAAPQALAHPPGILVVGPDGAVVERTPEAAVELEGCDADALPAAARAVAARAGAGEPARAALPRAGGGWVQLIGTRLGDRVVVLVERARQHELADVVARAHLLTPRERQVVERVARGLATREIAKELGISAWTVQDHLKSIFEKTGVGTRQALVAALFFGHWLPRHRDLTPSPHGFYLEGSALES